MLVVDAYCEDRPVGEW